MKKNSKYFTFLINALTWFKKKTIKNTFIKNRNTTNTGFKHVCFL